MLSLSGTYFDCYYINKNAISKNGFFHNCKLTFCDFNADVKQITIILTYLLIMWSTALSYS